MPVIPIKPDSPESLVDQIVSALKQRVEERVLRPGARMPSIRQFAEQHDVSRFTVVEAYDRLVAQGYLVSRRGSGFYVAARPLPASSEERKCVLERAVDAIWLMRGIFSNQSLELKAGCGWLPEAWLDQDGIQRSLRTLAREGGAHLTQYGEPKGHAPLRDQMQVLLAERGIAAQPSQIVLTKGASDALALVSRYLLQPGDTVLVDDPGYYTLFATLRLTGATLIGVPRTPDGPDLAALEKLVESHKPKALFMNTVLQNPTGTNLTAAAAYRILQLAERHDFIVVEDDVFADLEHKSAQRLATLDQLNRVVYLGSFSKTIAPALRVGYIACHCELAEALTNLKLLSGLTTSEICERVVYEILTDGHHRKHLDRVRERLGRAIGTTCRRLEDCGLTLYRQPEAGMFVWARLPEGLDAAEVARRAAQDGIMLAPGNVFSPRLESSGWLRFNVAFCGDGRLYRFLERAIEAGATGPARARAEAASH
ncbi:transcriptional regulator [Sulfurifustis variabilis]|uniref:Transcriptional regulator n=1 Tax=Sulfurifustis variabilis TaxID=1675686 RepID=A0A1C7AFW9_9GAMM|nr:PLP-dependent aminotransferase family protein [Sulfurifustis variabilis]BAU50316.1 transcriptional regulator [Sulfurifustis variabilis]